MRRTCTATWHEEGELKYQVEGFRLLQEDILAKPQRPHLNL